MMDNDRLIKQLQAQLRVKDLNASKAAEFITGLGYTGELSDSTAKAWLSTVECEQCICAAILMPNGEIVRGHRHDSCYDVVRKRPNASREAIVAAVQGFVTSQNRFVDRQEAMQIQRAAGKESAMHGKLTGDILFSEDLYLAEWERTNIGDGH